MIHTIEVENQVNALLLQVRRAESSARGYLLTLGPEFLSDHDAAVAAIPQALDKLTRQIGDNPAQRASIAKLREAVEARLEQFSREMDLVKRGEPDSAAALLRQAAASNSTNAIQEVGASMIAEEERLFRLRSANADRSQTLAASLTGIGSGLVVVLALLSIWLVRRSAGARDEAETRLRDANVNLEATVDERTADLREANDEIQRFAYIVSHDLRSPLVNIMGFTSELEELGKDIFGRIGSLTRVPADGPPLAPGTPGGIALEAQDVQLSQDFSEALGFIKSSIAKMDRLISAILNLTREGRREFQPVKIDTRELDRDRRVDAGASGGRSARRNSCRTAAQHRQRPPCAGADLLQSDRQRDQISQERSSRRDQNPRADQARLRYLRDQRQRSGHRSEGPSADIRAVPPCGNPGQAGPGHRPRPRACTCASSWGHHVGIVGTEHRQYIHDHAAYRLEHRQSEQRSMTQPVTIIMIEDDEGHARLIERNIRRSGVNNEIVSFPNGTDAMKHLFGADRSGLVQKGKALLILLDLNLPDMSGIDILKQIKENNYLKASPVVVLTTTDDSQEIKRCYELGCNVYITKPVNYENFANAIRQLGLFFSVIQVPPAAS